MLNILRVQVFVCIFNENQVIFTDYDSKATAVVNVVFVVWGRYAITVHVLALSERTDHEWLIIFTNFVLLG